MDRVDQETGEITRTRMPAEIAKAIVQVMSKVRQLGADDRNQHGGYKFVSIDKFYERIGPLMAEAGLFLFVNETASRVQVSEKSGNPWVFIDYELTFFHASGAEGPPLKRSIALPISGPQQYGAAQSYVEKQFLRQVFKVPTGEKDADDTPEGQPPAQSPSGVAPRSTGERQGSGSGPAQAQAPAAPSGGGAAPAEKHPRYDEAVEFFRAIRARIHAAPHLEALENTLRDEGFPPSASAEVMPKGETKAYLLWQVEREKGYNVLLATAAKRLAVLRDAEKRAGFDIDDVPV